ncbi:uncharacterized protein LOC114251150 [Bombyx mandarina]|uniref:Uncharacterized protein LOC114251150 n=1 Tax=Bombyx mandarina TaxID=7092 RepID=A0A6J2KGI0_BOMMA|nr:uncharacterized protein LOC114251150 [Bombyx mandarina]
MESLKVFCFALMAVSDVANAQCINRMLPLQTSILPVSETVIPNPANYVTACNLDYGLDALYQNPATTIIQDSTVANNLANALQLMVVSNLLSNTLPGCNDVVVPFGTVDFAPIPNCNNYGGYNYIF